MRSVSIVIPTRNEAENIDLLLNRIFTAMDSSEITFEIVFSDGASTDTTCDKIRQWQKTHPVQLVASEVNEGLSAAVIAGAHKANGKHIVVMDADLSHPPEKIVELLSHLVDGSHDMVIGSRYSRGGSTPDWPLSRKYASLLATLPARLYTDVKDPMAGFFAVHRKRLIEVTREISGFKIGLELLAVGGADLRVKEIPIEFKDRCHGISKMDVSVIFAYLKQLLLLAGVYLIPLPGLLLAMVLGGLYIATDSYLFLRMMQSGYTLGEAHTTAYLAGVIAIGLPMLTAYCQATSSGSFKQSQRVILSFVIVAFFLLFLRGGLIALSKISVEPEIYSIVLLSALTCTLLFFAMVSLVFSSNRCRVAGELLHRLYGFAVIFYIIALRLLYCGNLPLLGEEQYHIQQRLETFSWSNLLQYPLANVTWLTALGPWDESLFTCRLTIWLLWFVTLICIFNLARDMYSRTIAFRTVVLVAVLPCFFTPGLLITNDALWLLLWCALLYLAYRSLLVGEKGAWLITGAVLGVALLFDWLFLALLISFPIYYLISPDSRRYGLDSNMIYGVIAALCSCTGLLVATLLLRIQPFDHFYHGTIWLDGIINQTAYNSVVLALFYITPVGFIGSCYCCFLWLKKHPIIHMMDTNRIDGNRAFILSFLVVPLLFFLILSSEERGFLYSSGVVWTVMLPTVATTLFQGHQDMNGVLRIVNKAWWPMIIICLAGYALVLHQISFGYISV